jgi:hypothetical protein
MLTRVIALIFICGTLHAQVTEQWVKRYNGSRNQSDGANKLLITANGNIAVTGYSSEDSTGPKDICTILYNQTGDMLWKRTYNGPANMDDYAVDIKTDNSGNIIIAGSSIYQSPGYGAVIIKYNQSGNQQWIARDDVTGQYRFSTVIKIDNNGNIYHGEKHGTFSSGIGEILKYNPGGTILWQAQTGRVYDIEESNDGYIYAGGTINFKYFLNKYNSAGTLLRSDTLVFGPGLGSDAPCSISCDGNNNIYFTGTNGTHIRILKFNPSGQILWQDSCDLRYNTSILSSTDGSIYIGGSKFNNLNFDYSVIKYSGTGSLIWTGIYSGSNSANDYFTDMAFSKTGQIIATGFSLQGNNYGTSDFVTVKFSSSGGISWVKSYNGTGDSLDMAHSIIADTSGNIFIAGESIGTGTGLDFLTIKYSEPIGINESGTDVLRDFFLGQNYPNPFNPITIINYRLPLTSFVKIAVYDITGKEVVVLVNEIKKAGYYETEFDGRNLPSGVYYYQLSVGNKPPAAKKMVLIK